MYILFEGIDTSGKSTQIKRLCDADKTILSTQEPGGTILGKTLREIILNSNHKLSATAEFYLFLADRAEHYEKVIKPNRDKLILSDRGFISGMAYAFCNDENLQMEFLLRANKYALGNAYPDKIVLFETTEELLLQRLGEKSHDNIEERGIKYLMQVQESMKRIVDYTHIDCLHIDASQNIDEITKQIEGFIK